MKWFVITMLVILACAMCSSLIKLVEDNLAVEKSSVAFNLVVQTSLFVWGLVSLGVFV